LILNNNESNNNKFDNSNNNNFGNHNFKYTFEKWLNKIEFKMKYYEWYKRLEKLEN